VRIFDVDGAVHGFVLGAHPPKLTDEDIGLIHDLWMSIKDQLGTGNLRHRDVVSLALHRLERDLDGTGRDDILQQAVYILEREEHLRASPSDTTGDDDSPPAA
jgi:hypothetical protein